MEVVTKMREMFLEKAEALKPILHERKVSVFRSGTVVPEPGSWFGYRFEETEMPKVLRQGEQIWLDFGEHCTGNLFFQLDAPEAYPDAPMRLHVKLTETLQEMGDRYEDCQSRMCKAWLQEETVTLDEPEEVLLTRRFAFRYVRITVMDSNVPVSLNNIEVRAYTSADYSALKEGPKEERLALLDKIGVHTLAECMQSVFEDGPKRDRRLWIGDLRIQALVNYKTFDNLDLVKRCLYLFAGYTAKGKKTPRAVYVNSKGTYCTGAAFVDYSLMFNLILCEYYEHTKDETFVNELFAIADEQIKLACDEVGEDGIVEFRPVENLWAFIDHSKILSKIACMQGLILYSLDKMIWLCKETGRTKEAEDYMKIAERMKQASRKLLYDSENKAFISEYDKYQYSVHAQVWMVLGNVLTKEENQEVLRRMLQADDIIKPTSPYMHHYVVEAMLAADMQEEAMSYMENYWGQMADLGADTYWETFVPGHPEVSPYRDRIMDSACHAWSCSPSYFIRNYFN